MAGRNRSQTSSASLVCLMRPTVASSYLGPHLDRILPHAWWLCSVQNTEGFLYSSSADVIFFAWKTLSTLPHFQLIRSNWESQNRSPWSSRNPIPTSHPHTLQDLPGCESPHCVIITIGCCVCLTVLQNSQVLGTCLIYFSIFSMQCRVWHILCVQPMLVELSYCLASVNCILNYHYLCILVIFSSLILSDLNSPDSRFISTSSYKNGTYGPETWVLQLCHLEVTWIQNTYKVSVPQFSFVSSFSKLFVVAKNNPQTEKCITCRFTINRLIKCKYPCLQN